MSSSAKEKGTRAPYPVFLCYRRADTLKEATELQKVLDFAFGPHTAFRDEADVDWGKPWPDALRNALAAAEAVLVVIGPQWLAADKYGLRRIDQDDDWVRREIAHALATDKRVYPVLVHGAEVPPPQARLPDDIKRLSDLQADTFDFAHWADAQVKLAARLQADLGLTRAGAALPAPEAPPHDPLPAYREHLRRRHRNLVTFPGVDDAILEDVYVEIALARTSRGKRGEDPQAAAEAMAEAMGTREVKTLRQLLEASAESAGRTCWEVLGEPGAGKSTLLRYLAFDLGDPANPPSTPIPIYVPLAALSLAKRSPLQFAEDELRAEVDAAADGLAQQLAALAGKEGEPGRVWLLLDGLDEVAPEHQTAMRERLRALPVLLPGACLVVTARTVGHQTLGADFGRADLQSLDAVQQRRLLHGWLRDDAKVDAILARIAARPALAPVVRNPLLLTLVARLALEKQDLPSNRAELFQRALDLLLAKPYGAQPLTLEAPTEARFALRALALSLQTSDAPAWAKADLVKLLQQAKVDVSAWRTRDQFLDQVATRTGILAPHDGAQAPWRFLHRQFREVLAAEALRAIELAGGRWQDKVGTLNAASIPRWSETLGMFCAFAKDPLAVLHTMRAADVSATVRALPLVDGVAPAKLLEFLWETPAEITPKRRPWDEHHWDGVDLRALVGAWRDDCRATAPQVADLLWARVTLTATIEQLAWLHLALSCLSAVDRRRFFAQCGRPIDRVPAFDWVDVRVGEFVMGSPESEPGREANEGPQHQVRVPGFRLGKTVVTNAQYLAFDPAHEVEKWRGVSAKELGDHPVVNVSWWHAYLYCAWLGARLPSEAEWEYGCRAGTTTPFSFEANVTSKQVNYNGKHPYAGGKKGEYRERTVAVGSLPANAWGLHEMHGNVWEWCEDTMHDTYEGAPADGSAWTVGGSRDRVLRGGSWYDHAWWCRSAFRLAWPPGFRFDSVGFRPASSSLTPFTPSPPP